MRIDDFVTANQALDIFGIYEHHRNFYSMGSPHGKKDLRKFVCKINDLMWLQQRDFAFSNQRTIVNLYC